MPFIAVYDLAAAFFLFGGLGDQRGYEASGVGAEALAFLPAVFRH